MVWVVSEFTDHTIATVSEGWILIKDGKTFCTWPRKDVDKKNRLLMNGERLVTYDSARDAEIIAKDYSTMSSYEKSKSKSSKRARKRPTKFSTSESESDNDEPGHKKIKSMSKSDLKRITNAKKTYSYIQKTSTPLENTLNESVNINGNCDGQTSSENRENLCQQSNAAENITSESISSDSDDDDNNGSGSSSDSDEESSISTTKSNRSRGNNNNDSCSSSDSDGESSKSTHKSNRSRGNNNNDSCSSSDSNGESSISTTKSNRSCVNNNKGSCSSSDSDGVNISTTTINRSRGNYNKDSCSSSDSHGVNISTTKPTRSRDDNNCQPFSPLLSTIYGDDEESGPTNIRDELNQLKTGLYAIYETSNNNAKALQELKEIVLSSIAIFKDLAAEVFKCKEEIKKRNGLFTDMLHPDIEVPLKDYNSLTEKLNNDKRLIDNLAKYLATVHNENDEEEFVKASMQTLFTFKFLMKRVSWKVEPKRVLVKKSKLMQCWRESFKLKFAAKEPKTSDAQVNKFIHEACVRYKDASRKAKRKDYD